MALNQVNCLFYYKGIMQFRFTEILILSTKFVSTKLTEESLSLRLFLFCGRHYFAVANYWIVSVLEASSCSKTFSVYSDFNQN